MKIEEVAVRCLYCGGTEFDTTTIPPVAFCVVCELTPAQAYLESRPPTNSEDGTCSCFARKPSECACGAWDDVENWDDD